jgi:hypothetical protein
LKLVEAPGFERGISATIKNLAQNQLQEAPEPPEILASGTFQVQHARSSTAPPRSICSTADSVVGRHASRVRSPYASVVSTNSVPEVVFTVAEVAERLKVNDETVRRLFLHEPGVIVISFPRKGRRVYRTVRIPEDVLQRVLARVTR